MKRKANKLPKQRNAAAFALMLRTGSQGAHGKTKKAQRRADKISLKKEW